MQETHWMQLLRDVVHDLKAPLSSIKILIDGIEEVGDLNEKQQYFADRARIKLVHMIHMFNTVMEMAYIDADYPLQLAMIDLDAVIRRQVNLLEDVATQRHIDVSVQIADPIGLIEADERMINQVILNLLSNAIKYNTENGFVKITVSDAPDRVTMTIEDCGRGIPLADQPHVFDRFFRSKGASKIEGTGLGLSIVKTAIDRHDGMITLHSVLDQGTTFTVMLPRRFGASAEPLGRVTGEIARINSEGESLNQPGAPNKGDEITDAVDDRIQESQDTADEIADSHAKAGRQHG